MLKFVVVENDKKGQDTIVNAVKKFSYQVEEEVQTICYKEFNIDLQEEIEEVAQRKIYVLDILLENNMSGDKIAALIREKDWKSQIIFVTNYTEMLEQVYKNIYNVAGFIKKSCPNIESELKTTFKKVYKYSFDTGMFKFKNTTFDLQIYYSNITHITRDKKERKIIIHTKTNSYHIGISLQEALSLLDKRFKLVHRSCIANTALVEEYNWTKGFFVLIHGEQVNLLSKKYRNDILAEEEIAETVSV